jgi:hypothetical protein
MASNPVTDRFFLIQSTKEKPVNEDKPDKNTPPRIKSAWEPFLAKKRKPSTGLSAMKILLNEIDMNRRKKSNRNIKYLGYLEIL